MVRRLADGSEEWVAGAKGTIISGFGASNWFGGSKREIRVKGAVWMNTTTLQLEVYRVTVSRLWSRELRAGRSVSISLPRQDSSPHNASRKFSRAISRCTARAKRRKYPRN
jgi:hypothetical protein